MEIGKLISRLIRKKGFTQKEVAKRIDKSPTALSLIIKGEYNPNPETIKRLCDVFEIPQPIFYFLAISEDEIPEEKLHLYKILAPSIKEFILEVFGKEHDDLIEGVTSP